MSIVITRIILGVVLLTVILDAMRDRWLPKRCRDEAWLEWHLVKWGAFFPPLILLSYFWLAYYDFRLIYILIYILFVILCSIVWRFIYGFKNLKKFR